MSKDGPAISGGFRFGYIEAIRAGLPPKATNPRSPTTADLRAGQTLADFAAYPQRAKSIGKSVPKTLGLSEGRAAALQKIQELEKPSEIKFAPRLSNGVPLPIGPYHLCFVGKTWFWFHKKENKRSVTYNSAKRAEYVFLAGSISWVER